MKTPLTEMCRAQREQCSEGMRGCALTQPGPGLPLLLLPPDPLSVPLTFGPGACSALSMGTSRSCETLTTSGLRTTRPYTGSTPSAQAGPGSCVGVPPGLWSPHFVSSLFNCLSCGLQIPTSSDWKTTALWRLFYQLPQLRKASFLWCKVRWPLASGYTIGHFPLISETTRDIHPCNFCWMSWSV